jgi:hypothetical protein
MDDWGSIPAVPFPRHSDPKNLDLGVLSPGKSGSDINVTISIRLVPRPRTVKLYLYSYLKY